MNPALLKKVLPAVLEGKSDTMKFLILMVAFWAMARAPRPAGGPAAGGAPEGGQRVAVGLRKKLLRHAAQDVGVREKTGANDGTRVEQFLTTAGAKKGDPYCAAAVYTWGAEALGGKNPFPRSAWSPDFVREPTWTAARGGDAPRGGDVFGIWFSNKGRIAHCGLVEVVDGKWLVTVEANTGPDGAVGEQDRNGDGVRRKRRALSQVHAVKSWLP